MLVSAAIVAFFFLQGELLAGDNLLVKLLFELACVVSLIVVYVLMLSFVELMEAWDNNHPKGESELQPVKYTQQTILEMAAANDIIEFKVWLNGKAVKLGSSSDYDRKTDKFFDKLYYIGKAEYRTEAEFADALHELNGKKSLDVISIDGVAASKY